MLNSYTFEIKERYTYIRTKGQRNNLADIISGTSKVYEIVQKSETHFFLLDYRNTDFNVSRIEAFNIVRHFETNMPLLKDTCLSMIVNKKSYEVTKYWETICQQRGFNNTVFLALEEAEKWLLEQYELTSL